MRLRALSIAVLLLLAAGCASTHVVHEWRNPELASPPRFKRIIAVEISQQPYGQATPSQVALVKTGTGGAFTYTVTPNLYTTYLARWNNVASGTVVAQVAPKMRLLPGGKGYMKVVIASPVSLWHKHVTLQRLSPFGQWVTVANLALGEQNGRLFQPAAYLPRGRSVIRVFLSINQAGIGLLASHSGTQSITRR